MRDTRDRGSVKASVIQAKSHLTQTGVVDPIASCWQVSRDHATPDGSLGSLTSQQLFPYFPRKHSQKAITELSPPCCLPTFALRLSSSLVIQKQAICAALILPQIQLTLIFHLNVGHATTGCTGMQNQHSPIKVKSYSSTCVTLLFS